MGKHLISKKHISLDDAENILSSSLKLSEESYKAITDCRIFLENKLNNHNGLLYGINTGFGSLCNIRIADEDLQKLQENLILSHACGLGEAVPEEVVKLMLFLKIQSLSYGHSGVKTETVERLIYFYNNDLTPLVFQKGSLGASGDLAPLAHLSLPLIGQGHFLIKGEKLPAAEVLQKYGIEPLKTGAKEGLALLNGTQFMTAYGIHLLLQAKKINRLADECAALSMDAYSCKTEPFLPYIHNIRPHAGQKKTAENILALLNDSEIASQHKTQTQDPYAFRCVPQVHGASKDAIAYTENIFVTEMNSVTDNPNIFPDEELILSGGNFHGQPLALALDFMAIALAELGSISERRTYNLISGKRDLPEFLVANPGINSGMMIPQYSAAALVSENKQLCTPASVDSIPSSNGQEDHVSMGANAATKAYRVMQNLKNILAIEWLNAAQGTEFRRPLKTSTFLEKLLTDYRTKVAPLNEDHYMHEDITATTDWMNNRDFA